MGAAGICSNVAGESAPPYSPHRKRALRGGVSGGEGRGRGQEARLTKHSIKHVLEIDEYGILKKKEFYNKDDMQKIKVVKETTEDGFRKNTFIYR